MADFTTDFGTTNRRKARCRVCGKTLPRGTAVKFIEFLNDGYRCHDAYVCGSCEKATRPVGD